LGQVSLHRLEDRVVVEQPIQLGQHRVYLHPQVWDLGKQVHRFIAITEHRPPPGVRGTTATQILPPVGFRTKI